MDKRDYAKPHTYKGLPELLANTYDVALSEPERMATTGDLRRFLESAAMPVERSIADDDLAEVHAVREQVRAVFLAPSDAEALKHLNLLLSGVTPELRVLEADDKLSLLLFPVVSHKVAENVRSVVAIALGQVVERLGFDRLRACEADPCRDLFIDTSKKGARRFCSPRCASRKHVSTFRSRRAS
ncbi:CGNR zinc finger domain-containing protein [Phyllobacterium myrsinacearum]|uniref:Putative RNA-binding Zn ribbon-like protein n=1 Tax=Phyllobacterium myrsinacearum TaxID=28101 RepID=A0A839EGF2_9HYPH|nr:CGNR zinc finger domain-containing protein [Phyllobacterium myrsinacearum]MBA8879283.1 putative RNA-binding Zn ribbon-like protein [Phyllobacterium myrsinacearum]